MINTLFENKWISLREKITDEYSYTYSHEIRCDGQIVSVLPYRKSPLDGRIEFLLRSEFTPCWQDENVISSITGGVENNDPLYTAQLELMEEGGYRIELEKLVSLGTIYGIKSSDTVYHLYTCDLTNYEFDKNNITNTDLESKAHCFWATHHELLQSKDPFVYVNFVKLFENKII